MKTRLAAVYMEVRGVVDESVWNLKVDESVWCSVWNLKVWCMGKIRSVETPLTINTESTIFSSVARLKHLYGQ